MKKLLSALCSSALFITTSLVAPAPLMSHALAEEAPAAPATMTDADPALWVVKDRDTTIYLFGTVHVLKPGLSWFDEGVKSAFDASDELVIEMIEPDNATMMQKVNQYAIDPQKRALSSRLGEEGGKAYADALAKLGIPAPTFDPYEPWFAGVTLAILPLQIAGYDPASGAESVLTKAAKSAGKSVGQFETVDQQLGYFDTLPDEEQIAFLNGTVKEMPEMAEQMGTMVSLWADGDPDGLARMINESEGMTPALRARLLTERNARWADWIKARMDKPGKVFIAVGSGHLAGADSVQEMLKAKKLIAARVAY